MKKQTLTIGIPAFNERKNIGFLLREILLQDFDDIHLEKIIVASDGSTDKTVSEVRKLKDSKIEIIEGKERLGKNFRLNEIISQSKSNILILFDADILVIDPLFIKKLTRPIVNGLAEMTSAGLEELPPKKFFEKVLYVSMRLKEILFKEFKSGNNIFNCHGPARAFSKSLYKKISFPNSNADDMYSYLICKKKKKRFIYVSKAKIAYRLPASPTDHYKQSSRYIDAIEQSKKIFGEKFANKEFQISKKSYLVATLKALPFIVANFILVGAYLVTYCAVHIGKALNIKSQENWNVISSKTLN